VLSTKQFKKRSRFQRRTAKKRKIQWIKNQSRKKFWDGVHHKQEKINARIYFSGFSFREAADF